MGFSSGWQGCSSGFPSGFALGKSLVKSHGQKPLGPAPPPGFGLGTSLGTPFTTIPPRLFHTLSQHCIGNTSERSVQHCVPYNKLWSSHQCSPNPPESYSRLQRSHRTKLVMPKMFLELLVCLINIYWETPTTQMFPIGKDWYQQLNIQYFTQLYYFVIYPYKQLFMFALTLPGATPKNSRNFGTTDGILMPLRFRKFLIIMTQSIL